MTEDQPQSLLSGRKRTPCPVCGEISYSAGGVHPQCAVKQADAKRSEQIKRDKLAKPKSPTPAVNRWQKTCPKCKSSQHVRKKQCPCGYEFAQS